MSNRIKVLAFSSVGALSLLTVPAAFAGTFTDLEASTDALIAEAKTYVFDTLWVLVGIGLLLFFALMVPRIIKKIAGKSAKKVG